MVNRKRQRQQQRQTMIAAINKNRQMKKLTTLQDFENNNSDLVLGNLNSVLVFGGLYNTERTNDWCQTLDDTCVNGCEDIHHKKEVDGVVEYDHVDWK